MNVLSFKRSGKDWSADERKTAEGFILPERIICSTLVSCFEVIACATHPLGDHFHAHNFSLENEPRTTVYALKLETDKN